MGLSRDSAVAVTVSTLAVGAMAVDHLVGESEPGDTDSFPVDPAAFVITSALTIALAAVLFRFVVRPAADSRRLARKAVVVGVFAVLTVPLLFAGVPFVVAGAAIALGLKARERGHGRAGTVAVALGTLVVALGVGVYADVLVRR
jgi:hypothetical protein